jgi:kinesin family protein 5
VVELEMQLDEVREQYKTIARSTNSRAQQRRLEFMEHNLEALNSVQKQLVEQNTTLKKEVGLAEKRLIARNDRIQNLEQALSNANARMAAKEAKYEGTIQMLQERVVEGE